MVTITCSSMVTGRSFSPHSLNIPKLLEVVLKTNPGEVISVGTEKGKVSKEGVLIINGTIDDVLSFIEGLNKQHAINSDEVSIDLNVGFNNQCNFELTQHQLKRLSLLNVSLGISVYKDPYSCNSL